VDVIRRGEIWVANLNPRRGREVGKVRPVLAIQDEALMRAGSETIIVLPLTAKVDRSLVHTRVLIEPRGRLLRPSQILAIHPRTLDRARLIDGPLAILTAAEVEAVETRLLAALGVVAPPPRR